MSGLHIAAGAIIAVTAVIHSVLGERRVMAQVRAVEPAVLGLRLRAALGFTWHLAGLLMLLTAFTVAWPGTPAALVRLIGAVYVLLGLLSLAMTRGRHISGPLFTAGGLLALLG